jgi:predicted nuclease of predicted toxin-antitoxin system
MAMIHFHLDEHVPHAIAEGLRRRGIDVTTVEAGLRSATDDVHLAYALEQQRVIVTNDPDFLVLVQEDRPHMGIAYCDQGRRSIGEMIRRLVLLWERYPAEALRSRIVFL